MRAITSSENSRAAALTGPWINIRRSGITLYGPDARTFLPEITETMLSETLLREAMYLHELNEKPDSGWRDRPKYRAYAVLTICRILYPLSNRTIASKRIVARWALRILPDEWHR